LGCYFLFDKRVNRAFRPRRTPFCQVFGKNVKQFLEHLLRDGKPNRVQKLSQDDFTKRFFHHAMTKSSVITADLCSFRYTFLPGTKKANVKNDAP